MYYIIYKITCLVNNKIYIGKHQTKDLNDGYMGSGKLLRRAINKYGMDNFNKEILHIFNNESDMNAKEKELVVISEESYNLCPGGHGGFGYINDMRKKGIFPPAFTNTKTPKSKQKREETIAKKYHNSFYRIIGQRGNISFLNSQENDSKWYDEWKSKHKASLPANHQSGSLNSQYGKKFKFINNGTITKKVLVEELEQYLKLGYKLGRA